MIRVIIADDHDVVRQGLTLILEASHEIKVVAEHANGTDAFNWICTHECDVALVDIAMPGMNGIELINMVRKHKPKLPLLVFSAHPEDQYALRLIKAGAAGYLSKMCAPDEVVKAVRNVASGKRYITPSVAELLANEVSLPGGKLPHETLSNREYQIFVMLASSKTQTEIASILNLSVKTIGTYRTRILEKMGVQNNADLMRYAIDKQIIG